MTIINMNFKIFKLSYKLKFYCCCCCLVDFLFSRWQLKKSTTKFKTFCFFFLFKTSLDLVFGQKLFLSLQFKTEASLLLYWEFPNLWNIHVPHRINDKRFTFHSSVQFGSDTLCAIDTCYLLSLSDSISLFWLNGVI